MSWCHPDIFKKPEVPGRALLGDAGGRALLSLAGFEAGGHDAREGLDAGTPHHHPHTHTHLHWVNLLAAVYQICNWLAFLVLFV